MKKLSNFIALGITATLVVLTAISIAGLGEERTWPNVVAALALIGSATCNGVAIVFGVFGKNKKWKWGTPVPVLATAVVCPYALALMIGNSIAVASALPWVHVAAVGSAWAFHSLVVAVDYSHWYLTTKPTT